VKSSVSALRNDINGSDGFAFFKTFRMRLRCSPHERAAAADAQNKHDKIDVLRK
jgi:hypothetical protein